MFPQFYSTLFTICVEINGIVLAVHCLEVTAYSFAAAWGWGDLHITAVDDRTLTQWMERIPLLCQHANTNSLYCSIRQLI